MFAHGVVEGATEHLDEEVDGISAQFALGPAPIGVFDDEAREGRQLEVAAAGLGELEAAFFEQRQHCIDDHC